MRPAVLYPASNDLDALSRPAISTKIARHSPCSVCDCGGMRPTQDLAVVLDDTPIAISVMANPPPQGHPNRYLGHCDCGHNWIEHGNDEDLPQEEITRRAKVAIRLDELLEDNGKLLDFSYVDDDIESLRKQMKLREDSPLSDSALFSPAPSRKRSPSRSSSPSDSTLHPGKKARLSSSSDLSEDEEDKPLAERIPPQRNGNGAGLLGRAPRAGKKAASGMTVGGKTGPKRENQGKGGPAKHANGINGVHSEKRTRPEDLRLEQSHLARIATGVTVDSGLPSAHPEKRPEKAAVVEQREGIIRITPVANDGQPRSLVILTGLKSLFQKQLPKMPREYITRLVFDDNSRALAIIKRGYKVVGGITFRPFPHRGFAEIVFFATASVDQVRGYGGLLMNHYKMYIRNTYPGMMHFLTYADNYAVGYFKKQGFSKEITLDRSIWAGYIKDYEGGTLMQCTMVRKIDYLTVRSTLVEQREAIMSKIREMSRSHEVHEGLTHWKDVKPGEPAAPLDPKEVPGLKETGWTIDMQEVADSGRPLGKSAEHARMRRILSDLQAHPLAWAFLTPVNRDDVPDYYDVIKHPMDFSLIEHKLDHNQYGEIDGFLADVNLTFTNCLFYNPEGSTYARNTMKLQKHLEALLERTQDA